MACRRHGDGCHGHASEPDYERPVLDVDEVKRIVAAASDDEERAVLLLTCDLALRASEVSRVQGSGVDSKNNRIRTPRKKAADSSRSAFRARRWTRSGRS